MWTIYWILLGKNLVIQKEIFLSSFCNECRLDSTNPVCTSNPEDIHQSCHDHSASHLLWVQNRYIPMAISMVVVSALHRVAKQSVEIYLEIAKHRITASLESSPALWLPSPEIVTQRSFQRTSDGFPWYTSHACGSSDLHLLETVLRVAYSVH